MITVHIICDCVGCTHYVCVCDVGVIMVHIIYESVGCYTMYVCVMLACSCDNGTHYM